MYRSNVICGQLLVDWVVWLFQLVGWHLIHLRHFHTLWWDHRTVSNSTHFIYTMYIIIHTCWNIIFTNLYTCSVARNSPLQSSLIISLHSRYLSTKKNNNIILDAIFSHTFTISLFLSLSLSYSAISFSSCKDMYTYTTKKSVQFIAYACYWWLLFLNSSEQPSIESINEAVHI